MYGTRIVWNGYSATVGGNCVLLNIEVKKCQRKRERKRDLIRGKRILSGEVRRVNLERQEK